MCCVYMYMDKMFRGNNNVNYHQTETCSYTTLASREMYQPLPADESDFLEFWNKNYQNCHACSEKGQRPCLLENDIVDENGLQQLDEILNHVPPLPSYLREIGEKKVNFIMIATTLDERSLLNHLENTLAITDFQAFPLTFEEHTFQDIYEGKYWNILSILLQWFY